MNHVDLRLQVFRRHANELPKFGIADRIDGDAAEEAELPDKLPCRMKILESSVARQTTPASNDPKTPAPNPVTPQVDDKVFFAAHDNERPEHVAAVLESRAQVCLLEGVVQSFSPVHTASLFTSVEPVT